MTDRAKVKNKPVKHCLVYLMSPAHVISSISAIKSLHDSDEVRVTIAVWWHNDTVIEDLLDVVKNLTKEFSFIETLVELSQTKVLDMLSLGEISAATTALKKEVGIDSVDEIYYAHDVVGELYQLLCSAYPKAYRVCFGEPFGTVYEKSVHLSYLTKRSGNSDASVALADRINLYLSQLFKFLKTNQDTSNHRLSLANEMFYAHHAVLILPVDQSGRFLRKIPLTVCEKSVVGDIVDRCASSTIRLQQYIEKLLLKYRNQNKLLLLTENLAEGNFIDFEREIDMWCEIIQQHCNPGGVVFLKSHPGEILPRNDRIKERLDDFVDVIELDSEFKRYPIEIWKDLVCNCKIACMSYPTLSLKYLYDIDVIQPMNEEFIEHWFPEWTWASYKNALSLYMEPLKRLHDWDGKSILWAGHYDEF